MPNTNKNIEVEIRGPLSREQFDDLVRRLEDVGEKVIDKDRVLIDYSTFLDNNIEDRTKDIRLRVTNGVPEMIVKLGNWGGAEQRKELSVTTKSGEFDTLVEIFGALGFTKGMLCIRKSKVYMYKEIEFALVEVPGHSYYYEAEKMAAEGDDTDKLIQEMTNECANLDLSVFSKKQFFEYIEELNKKANEVFDFTNYKTGYFKDRFGL
jgi:predicted adenylyl cyclase CyaB